MRVPGAVDGNVDRWALRSILWTAMIVYDFWAACFRRWECGRRIKYEYGINFTVQRSLTWSVSFSIMYTGIQKRVTNGFIMRSIFHRSPFAEILTWICAFLKCFETMYSGASKNFQIIFRIFKNYGNIVRQFLGFQRLELNFKQF